MFRFGTCCCWIRLSKILVKKLQSINIYGFSNRVQASNISEGAMLYERKKTQLKTYKSDFFALNTLLTSQAEQFYSAQWSQMIQEVLLARYFDPPNFTKCFYPMTNLNLTSTYVQACSLLFRTIVSCCIHLIFELSPKEMPQIFSRCSVSIISISDVLQIKFPIHLFPQRPVFEYKEFESKKALNSMGST